MTHSCKRTVAVLSAAAMLVSLTACGGGGYLPG